MPGEAILAEPAASCLSDKAVLASKECEEPAAQEDTRDAPAVADAQSAEASNAAQSDGKATKTGAKVDELDVPESAEASHAAASDRKATATGAKVDELDVPEGIQTWPDEKPAISKEDEDRLLKVHHRCTGFHSACQWYSNANSIDF